MAGASSALSPMLAYDPATNPLNTNEWAFPLCECVHIAAFAFSIGMIALVDLRMLGWGVTDRSAAQLARDTEIWTLLGLIAVITSGLAIFSSDPVHYMHNGAFQFKMLALVVAMLFHYTIHRRVNGASVAIFSIGLWWSIILAGVFIGFI